MRPQLKRGPLGARRRPPLNDLAPKEVFARLNDEAQRVGTSVDAIADVLRDVFGGPDLRVVRPTGEVAINVDLTILQMALSVLQSLPANAGRTRFVEAMTTAIIRDLHDAGA